MGVLRLGVVTFVDSSLVLWSIYQRLPAHVSHSVLMYFFVYCTYIRSHTGKSEVLQATKCRQCLANLDG